MDPTRPAGVPHPASATGAPPHGMRRRHLAALTALLLAVVNGGAGAATPPQAPALGAHTLLGQSEGQGSSPAVSAPIDTQPDGSSLLVLVGGYASNDAAPTDSYGNHWKPLGGSVYYRGYENRFSARAYLASEARGGPEHRLSIVKPGNAAGELSAPFIEIRHAGMLQAVAQNYPAPGFAARLARAARRAAGAAPDSTGTLTSGKVTTTGPATLVAVWWGDSRALKMTATPNQGFKVIEQWLDLPPNSAVQCAVAVKQVDGPGTWDVSWTSTPAQGAILWLFAFQARP